ncbi:unnamed protein product [Zymoseptoria tritici ST99CH_1A5]|uniref:Uncharacterized protein n=1 Tax=Zymoseptoria tritici ST99CH_1A5 TaxID=1276529 RepID=A0A1Y6LZ17_ZYMTR|nr:unnamed protein product [Zymoseptoria tritici ST99CH_1A5]
MVLPDKANASKALPSKARQHASSKIPNIPFVRVDVGDPNGPPDQYHTFRLPGKLLASRTDYFKKAIERPSTWFFRTLFDLYIFADQYLAPEIGMLVTKAIQLKSYPREKDPASNNYGKRIIVFPSADDITYLYANTSPTSLLRGYLARLLAERTSTSNTREYNLECNPEHEPDQLFADEQCEEDELADYPPELLVSALVVSGRMLRATKCLNCSFGDMCQREGHSPRDFMTLELRFCEWHGHEEGGEGEGGKKGCEIVD